MNRSYVRPTVLRHNAHQHETCGANPVRFGESFTSPGVWEDVLPLVRTTMMTNQEQQIHRRAPPPWDRSMAPARQMLHVAAQATPKALIQQQRPDARLPEDDVGEKSVLVRAHHRAASRA